MKIQLIDDWKKALKLHSVQVSLAGLSFNTLLGIFTKGAAIAVEGVGVLPARWLIWLMVAWFSGNILARVIKQKPMPAPSEAAASGQ